jgi:hypothetical protein
MLHCLENTRFGVYQQSEAASNEAAFLYVSCQQTALIISFSQPLAML